MSTFTSDLTAVLGVVTNTILPAFAQAQVVLTPGITADQLTTTLESDLQSYVAQKYPSDAIVVEILFAVPSLKQQIEKAVSYVVAKVVPAVNSATASNIAEGLAIGATALTPQANILNAPSTTPTLP